MIGFSSKRWSIGTVKVSPSFVHACLVEYSIHLLLQAVETYLGDLVVLVTATFDSTISQRQRSSGMAWASLISLTMTCNLVVKSLRSGWSLGGLLWT